MERRTFTQNQRDGEHHRPKNDRPGAQYERDIPIPKEEYLQISHRQITSEHIPIARDILQKGLEDAEAALKHPPFDTKSLHKKSRAIGNYTWAINKLDELGTIPVANKHQASDEYAQKAWQPYIERSQKSLTEDAFADKHALVVNTIGQAFDKIKATKLQIINDFTKDKLGTLAYVINNYKGNDGDAARIACQKLRLFRGGITNPQTKGGLEARYGIIDTPEKGIAALDEYRNGLNSITILNSITDSNTQGTKGALYRAREDINKKYKDAGLS